MENSIKTLSILSTLIVLFTFSGFTQNRLEISGWVKHQDKAIRKAEVRIFDGLKLVEKTNSNRWGNFSIHLPTGKEYMMVISKDKKIQKRIVINTHIHSEAEYKNMFFEFIAEIDPTKEEDSPNKHFLVSFDSGQNSFIYLEPIISENLINLESEINSDSYSKTLEAFKK